MDNDLVNAIKPEEPEADHVFPPPLDDDIYEDAGDLEFNQNAPGFNNAYIARIPRYLWEAWSQFGDDEEIQIGTIRVALTKGKDGSSVPEEKMSILLDSTLAQHQVIPKEFDLAVLHKDTTNTFVFTEQDLPGYKSRSSTTFDLATANMPARLRNTQKDKPQQPKQPFDPNKRFQPYFRKGIPKRTTLAARVTNELNCLPVENAESSKLIMQRTADAMKPKAKTRFILEDTHAVGGGYIHAGTSAASSGFNITRGKQTAAQKAQTQKTARMPQNELLDRLFACFRRYRYWSMKALRHELQQPEAYLRETLDRIAVLARSGRFATQWSLKPENMQESFAGVDEEAPGGEGPEDSDADMEDDDDEDPDIKFEDV